MQLVDQSGVGWMGGESRWDISFHHMHVKVSFNEDFRTNWEKGGGFNLNCTPPHFPYPMKICARPVLGSKF